MALGNADVKIPLWECLRKALKPDALLHRGSDGADRRVLTRHLRQRFAENGRKGLFLLTDRLAGHGIELPNAVEFLRGFLRRGKALALFGAQMQKHRLVERGGGTQQLRDGLHIVPVHRAEIGKAHVLEERFSDQMPADAVFQLVRKGIQPHAARNVGRKFAVPELEIEV